MGRVILRKVEESIVQGERSGEVTCSICGKKALVGLEELPEGWELGPGGFICDECARCFWAMFGDAIG